MMVMAMLLMMITFGVCFIGELTSLVLFISYFVCHFWSDVKANIYICIMFLYRCYLSPLSEPLVPQPCVRTTITSALCPYHYYLSLVSVPLLHSLVSVPLLPQPCVRTTITLALCPYHYYITLCPYHYYLSLVSVPLLLQSCVRTTIT